jgi:hypothetical protein
MGACRAADSAGGRPSLKWRQIGFDTLFIYHEHGLPEKQAQLIEQLQSQYT